MVCKIKVIYHRCLVVLVINKRKKIKNRKCLFVEGNKTEG